MSKKFNYQPLFLKYSIIIWQNVGVGSKIGVKGKIIIDQRYVKNRIVMPNFLFKIGS